MSSIDPVFRWPVRLSAALGYDELDGEQKSKDDIAADLDYRDTFTEDFLTQVGSTTTENAAWTGYTPTFVNFTLGDGTINRARYRVTATTVLLQVTVTLGASSVMGSIPTISLPVAAASGAATCGSARYLDNGTRHYVGVVIVASSGLVANLIQPGAGNSGLVDATNPYTWATGDIFQFTIEYERTT